MVLFVYNNMRDFDILRKIIYKKLPINDKIEVSLTDEEINPGYIRTIYNVYTFSNHWFYEESIDISIAEYREATLEKLL